MKFVLLFLLLLTSACGKVQDSCGFQIDGDQRVSWKHNLPIQINLVNPPSEFNQSTIKAMSTWNKAADKTLFILGSGVQNVNFINNWTAPANQEAYTNFNFFRHTIFHTEIDINLKFNFSENPNYNQIDAESLMLHELGHVLGLVHVEDQESVMNPVLYSGQIRRNLYEIDINNLRCEY